ncbi:MAG: hypothetical protein Q8M24_18605 [Pseudolabrys sp.]|nr:hypothetical protein [Pseudolabrys sp.]MDP2297458.1 hypothetical protein [Pseudolabrys sp.]
MSRSIETRLARLEEARGVREAPHLVFGSEPLPDEPLTDETVERWIKNGMAHIASGVIFYDGGEPGPLTMDEWEARYAPGWPAALPVVNLST